MDKKIYLFDSEKGEVSHECKVKNPKALGVIKLGADSYFIAIEADGDTWIGVRRTLIEVTELIDDLIKMPRPAG